MQRGRRCCQRVLFIRRISAKDKAPTVPPTAHGTEHVLRRSFCSIQNKKTPLWSVIQTNSFTKLETFYKLSVLLFYLQLGSLGRDSARLEWLQGVRWSFWEVFGSTWALLPEKPSLNMSIKHLYQKHKPPQFTTKLYSWPRTLFSSQILPSLPHFVPTLENFPTLMI